MCNNIKLTLVLVFFITIGFGQNIDSILKIDLATIVKVNQGNSYVTFPMDIGNIEKLWFEGNVIPNFNIRKSKDARLMGVITPQIIIRMYQEESFPVRTPSYIPQITIFYLLNSKTVFNSLSLYGKLAHHSNGQDGAFYLDDGSINLKTGNFTTNYFEFGINKTNYSNIFNATQFFNVSIEAHPTSWTDSNLKDIYSKYYLHTKFSIFKLPLLSQFGIKKAKFSFKSEASFLFGNTVFINDILSKTNLNFTFFYHPKFLEDIGFFVQFYHGMDYYNIYFNHKINIIRFGIMTEILRF